MVCVCRFKDKLRGVSIFLLLCGFQGLGSGYQAHQQVPSPAEVSASPLSFSCLMTLVYMRAYVYIHYTYTYFCNMYIHIHGSYILLSQVFGNSKHNATSLMAISVY